MFVLLTLKTSTEGILLINEIIMSPNVVKDRIWSLGTCSTKVPNPAGQTLDSDFSSLHLHKLSQLNHRFIIQHARVRFRCSIVLVISCYLRRRIFRGKNGIHSERIGNLSLLMIKLKLDSTMQPLRE